MNNGCSFRCSWLLQRRASFRRRYQPSCKHCYLHRANKTIPHLCLAIRKRRCHQTQWQWQQPLPILRRWTLQLLRLRRALLLLLLRQASPIPPPEPLSHPLLILQHLPIHRRLPIHWRPLIHQCLPIHQRLPIYQLIRIQQYLYPLLQPFHKIKPVNSILGIIFGAETMIHVKYNKRGKMISRMPNENLSSGYIG